MNKRSIVGIFLAAAATLVFLGCSGSASQAPSQNTTTGVHPATWTQDHWSAYLKDPASCATCHGSTTDPAQAGGISKVSCFGCHHPNGPHHAAGWADPAQHGRMGAQAVPNGEFGFLGTGFVACTQCHGSTYTNPIGIAPSCESCHTTAPHPAKPWMDAANPINPNHDQTDQANASECVKCHALGANSTIQPKTPAPAGTAPGCFNGTLCHTNGF